MSPHSRTWQASFAQARGISIPALAYASFLETERLLLRRATLEDARLLYELDSDPEVMR
jgi:RimJ/RimL family protein N-acetyltransferase